MQYNYATIRRDDRASAVAEKKKAHVRCASMAAVLPLLLLTSAACFAGIAGRDAAL